MRFGKSSLGGGKKLKRTTQKAGWRRLERSQVRFWREVRDGGRRDSPQVQMH
jgi:hypothetical protein